MIVTAIITEYNPFHNGHLYHIKKARSLTNADFIIAIMSGNYVQRGYPSIINKYSRTEAALKNGCDLVIELPVCYSTASAENFALGAVSILDKLGIVDYICFGSECGDISILKAISDVIRCEPDAYKQVLSDELKNGLSFPFARAKAVKNYLHDKSDLDNTMIADLVSSPNNILGIEYIKALCKLNSTIKPITIERIDNGYNDEQLSSTVYTSATSIRKNIMEESTHYMQECMDVDSSLANYIPQSAFDCMFKINNFSPVHINDYSILLYHSLLFETPKSLTRYCDIDKSLGNKIINGLEHFSSITQFADYLKTKDITHSRITRCLMHIILNINNEQFKEFKDNGITGYARILGFNTKSSSLIRHIKNNCNLVVINKLSSALLTMNKTDCEMLMLDIKSTHLYNKVVYCKTKNMPKDEYRQDIIKI